MVPMHMPAHWKPNDSLGRRDMFKMLQFHSAVVAWSGIHEHVELDSSAL